MPIVHFTGYVEPRNVKASVGPFIIEEWDQTTDTVMKFTVNIAEGHVGIECELSQFNRELHSALTNRSTELARTALDMLSFQTGYGFFLYIDKFYDVDGKEETLMTKNPRLGPLCTAYSQENFQEILDMVAYEPNLYMALNDLVVACTAGRQAAINCTRAMDAIKYMISPGAKDIVAWPAMREALNLSETYLRFITDFSKDHRHGNRTWQPSDPIEEDLERSWIIMDRFLIIKKRKLSQLPLSEFPVLEETPLRVEVRTL
jgi:hypothetical protein